MRAPSGKRSAWTHSAKLRLRGILAGTLQMFTGSLVSNGIGDGKDDKEQLTYLLEQIALICTLLLSVIYPSFQEATARARWVMLDDRAAGLCWVFLTSMSTYCAFVASILAACILMLFSGCASDSEFLYLVRSARRQLRVPYVCYSAAAYFAFFTATIEGYIRSQGYSNYPSDDLPDPSEYDEDALAQATSDVATMIWVLVPPFFMLASYSLYGTSVYAFHSAQLFSARADAATVALRREDSDGSHGWYAQLTGGEIRDLCTTYFQAYEGVPYGNPNPDHFVSFILTVMRERGHSELTYVDRCACSQPPQEERGWRGWSREGW